MLNNQKFPGETDSDGNSKASVTTKHDDGGTSQEFDWQHVQGRGGLFPASIQRHVDGQDDHHPLVTEEIHFQHPSAAADVAERLHHDHSIKPAALPSPAPHRHSKTYHVNAEQNFGNADDSFEAQDPVNNTVSVSKKGAIGK
jgi:hypothetical protein